MADFESLCYVHECELTANSSNVSKISGLLFLLGGVLILIDHRTSISLRMNTKEDHRIPKIEVMYQTRGMGFVGMYLVCSRKYSEGII